MAHSAFAEKASSYFTGTQAASFRFKIDFFIEKLGPDFEELAMAFFEDPDQWITRFAELVGTQRAKDLAWSRPKHNSVDSLDWWDYFLDAAADLDSHMLEEMVNHPLQESWEPKRVDPVLAAAALPACWIVSGDPNERGHVISAMTKGCQKHIDEFKARHVKMMTRAGKQTVF